MASSEQSSAESTDQLILGIGLVLAGSFFFVVQDAGMKWLTAQLAILQLIFLRNVFGLVLVGGAVLLKRERIELGAAQRGKLLIRTVFYVVGWCFFFTALKYLPLATAAALFFSFPIMLTALSVPLLKETVGPRRWMAVVFGFSGVVLMTKPGADFSSATVLMLVAAFCWTMVAIFTRQLGKSVKPTTMMLYSLTAFVLAMAPAQFWVWHSVSVEALALLCGIAFVGVIAQFCLTKAYSNASPSIIAPFEYSGLVWAALFGFAIWGDLPDRIELIGAAMIVLSGLYICHRETGLFQRGVRR